MNEPVLRTERLERRFGGIIATDSVSLSLAPGARHALIGPNGAGKTTLVNLLTGVIPPSGGRILLDGQDITGLSVHARVARGMVRTFQISQLFASLTPRETLALVLARHRGIGHRWWGALSAERAVLERTDQLLEQFRLATVRDVRTDQLAYGKRRLLEIAIALACEPRVLLLDEPVAGVPAGEREEILQTVGALPADVSILLIEHDMALVFGFSRFITVLVNGAVLVEGEPSAIASDPRVKAVYLGSSGEHGA
jgi:branched-chain amino acid transport system ATP-binding protein